MPFKGRRDGRREIGGSMRLDRHRRLARSHDQQTLVTCAAGARCQANHSLERGDRSSQGGEAGGGDGGAVHEVRREQRSPRAARARGDAVGPRSTGRTRSRGKRPALHPGREVLVVAAMTTHVDRGPGRPGRAPKVMILQHAHDLALPSPSACRALRRAQGAGMGLLERATLGGLSAPSDPPSDAEELRLQRRGACLRSSTPERRSRAQRE